MKLKKIITMGLAAIMVVSAFNFPALANDDENSVVYSYTDENKNEVNITQADLDAGHWDKDALDTALPQIYKNFPMSLSGYSNDYAELYLDCEYMKKLEDMDFVHIKIADFRGRNVIMDADLTTSSFYSPLIQVGETYDVTLTECVDGITNTYSKSVIATKSEAEMPSYVTENTDNEDATIMICDVDTLKAGKIKTDENKYELDTEEVKYEQIKACDFKTYCEGLPTNKEYRIYTINNNKIYSGYIYTGSIIKPYDYGIEELSLTGSDVLGEVNSVASIPSYTITDIKNNAEEIAYGEYIYQLKENNNSNKYVAVKVGMPTSFFDGSSNPSSFRVTTRGESEIMTRIWYSVDGGSLYNVYQHVSENGTNCFTYDIEPEYSANTSVIFYIMVYMTGSTGGYVSVDVEPIAGGSYEDGETGSAYDAYYGANSYSQLSNSQFKMMDSWDIDRFYINYAGNKPCTYKIELKNRSTEEQNALENPSGYTTIKGSRAKYLVLQSVRDRGTVVSLSDYAIYEVPKNADVTVYNQISISDAHLLSIYEQKMRYESSQFYQLALTKYLGN